MEVPHLATAAPMVPEPTGVLRQSTAGLIRFMSTRSLYCTMHPSTPQQRTVYIAHELRGG